MSMDFTTLRLSSFLTVFIFGVFLYAFTANAAMLAPVSIPEDGILQPTEEVGIVQIAVTDSEQDNERVLLAISVKDTGLEETASSADLKGQKKLPVVIGRIISIALGMVGVVFLIIMIYGGFLYLTAGGNKDQVGQAVNYIKNGAIGVAIIFASYAITNFVVKGVLDASTNTQTSSSAQTTPASSCSGTCRANENECISYGGSGISGDCSSTPSEPFCCDT